MPKTETEEAKQVNVQLTAAEMAELEAICQAESINRPSTLVGIWIRSNIKARAGFAQLVDLVKEAQDAGVDVVTVLARAKARASR